MIAYIDLLHKYDQTGDDNLRKIIARNINDYIHLTSFYELKPKLLLGIFDRSHRFPVEVLSEIVKNIKFYHPSLSMKEILSRFGIDKAHREKVLENVCNNFHVNDGGLALKYRDLEHRIEVLERSYGTTNDDKPIGSSEHRNNEHFSQQSHHYDNGDRAASTRIEDISLDSIRDDKLIANYHAALEKNKREYDLKLKRLENSIIEIRNILKKNRYEVTSKIGASNRRDSISSNDLSIGHVTIPPVTPPAAPLARSRNDSPINMRNLNNYARNSENHSDVARPPSVSINDQHARVGANNSRNSHWQNTSAPSIPHQESRVSIVTGDNSQNSAQPKGSQDLGKTSASPARASTGYSQPIPTKYLGPKSNSDKVMESESSTPRGREPILNSPRPQEQRRSSAKNFVRQVDLPDICGGRLTGKVHKACASGDIQQFKALTDRDKRLLVQRDQNGWTPLHYAACYNHIDIVEHILQRGINVNILNNYQRTPLHIACEKGHKEVAELLLKRGAVPKLYDYFGKTPFQYAHHYSRKDICMMLKQYGG